MCSVALLVLVLVGCQHDLPDLPRQMLPPPAPADVESVLFLVGDAGAALPTRSPTMHVLRDEIETWSERLARDSSVLVVFLGDNVYPDGVHPPDHPSFPQDSTYMMAQVQVFGGPYARRYARGYFVAGNHDWGDARGIDGVHRLENMERFLERRSAEGYPVVLEPEAGEPGPALVDVGDELRLLLYDTTWWLLASDDARKWRVFQQSADALRSAGDRTVIFVSHHPFQSASSHGGHVGFWKTVGVRFLLARSGAILQDLNSVPYREFTELIMEAFRASRPPFVWAGGHDHSLQVIRNLDPVQPGWSLVSGSGSKVSRVGHMDGMQYRHAAPGFMKLFFLRDGGVSLYVTAAPSRDYLSCQGEGATLAACMARATAAFETTFAKRLR